MIIVAFDPAVRNLGYVVLKKSNGCFNLLDFGVVSPKEAVPESLYLTKTGKRKKNLENLLLNPMAELSYSKDTYDFVLKLLKKYSPNAVCIEKPDLRPFIPRRTQAMLYVVYTSILLALANSKVKAELFSLSKPGVDKLLGLKGRTNYRERKKFSVERYKDIIPLALERKISKGKIEHITDSLMVAEAYLKFKGILGGIELCQK